jgi:putative heme-binding domain-containing protein
VNRLFLAAIFFAASLEAQSTIAKLSAADVARGKQLYENQCSVCHGQTGTGGKGPRLAQPVLHRAPDDDRLAEVIKNGIPNTEMPNAWQMTDREIWQVAGYVRSMGRTPIVPLPGDSARGRALYEKNGCAACHIVRGSGTALGPELTDIGARRSPDYLREALVKPGASVPEGFLMISATTRDGKTIRGMRVNEDTFTIQLRDASGRVYSFRKSSLASLKKEFNQSLMPGYQSKLSAGELDDLVAYLASLRGDPSVGASVGASQ